MRHSNNDITKLLEGLDLGSPVAETDHLLQTARVDTSAFNDLLKDTVDLVPGTKGSGKSALFRIFVHFLPDHLLTLKRVVVAHGVERPGDPVFLVFQKEFEELNEQEFVSFWCVYLASLANKQFVKEPRFAGHLAPARAEIEAFRAACTAARIPDLQRPTQLRDVLAWVLAIVRSMSPRLTYKPPGDSGQFGLDLFGNPSAPPLERSPGKPREEFELPRYAGDIRETLETVLQKADLSLWLMIDRLDEIFPRRSPVERTALRGLLRAMRIFSSDRIRVKVFLRDDMLEQVVRGENGFPAFTHATGKKADTLMWTQEQILQMIVKRFFADRQLSEYLRIDRERLNASAEYRNEAFYRIFPASVHRGKKQTSTLKWIYTRCADGRGVVTPRDVLDMLIHAKRHQQDVCRSNPAESCDDIISPASLQFGHAEMSRGKRIAYLQAEFPHLWKHIEKLMMGKSEHSEASLQRILGRQWKEALDDLLSIGLLERKTRRSMTVYTIPLLYHKALDITRGRA